MTRDVVKLAAAADKGGKRHGEDGDYGGEGKEKGEELPASLGDEIAED